MDGGAYGSGMFNLNISTGATLDLRTMALVCGRFILNDTVAAVTFNTNNFDVTINGDLEIGNNIGPSGATFNAGSFS